MPHGTWGHRTMAQLTYLGICQGQRVANVFAFEASTATEVFEWTDALRQTSLATLMSDFDTAIRTAYKACLPTDYTLQKLRGQIVEVPSQYEHRLSAQETTMPAGQVGTAANASGNLPSAAVIKWTSTIAGRSHRGRTFVGPIETGGVLAGSLVAGTITYVTALKTALINNFSVSVVPAVNWAFTVYSRPLDVRYTKTPGSSPPTWVNQGPYDGNSSNILAGTVDTVGRTQRRREIGVGS